MNEARIEQIYSIEWHHQPDSRRWKHFTLYPSGFLNLDTGAKPEPLTPSDGWHQVDDLRALQTLFDFAKEAVRSRPAPALAAIPDKPLWVRVHTTEGVYLFEEDIVKLKDAALPACHPFE